MNVITIHHSANGSFGETLTAFILPLVALHTKVKATTEEKQNVSPRCLWDVKQV